MWSIQGKIQPPSDDDNMFAEKTDCLSYAGDDENHSKSLVK